MWDLFVSYSNRDGRPLAERVKAVLESELSLRVFVSDHDGQRTGDYDQELRRVLCAASRFLVLWTPGAAESPWVIGEAEEAAKLHKEFVVFTNPGKSPPPRISFSVVTPITDENELIKTLKSLPWGIDVIVPASGKSSGIYPLNEAMPKVLLPIGDKPLLHHIIDTLRDGPWSGIHIVAGPFARMMEHYIGWARPGLACCVHDTEEPTLSAALLKLKPTRPFLLYFSDILLYDKPDWRSFVQAHRDNRDRFKVIGTLMQSKKYRLNVGRITPDAQHPQLIGRFEEKPEDTGQHHINMAVSIFEPEFLDYLHADDQSLFGQTIPRAIEAKGKFAHSGYTGRWAHIQTLNDWRIVQKDAPLRAVAATT